MTATPQPIATVRSYDELRRAVADYCDRIGMTRMELDRRAGITEGHAGKLLARKAVKKFGPMSLGLVLAATGLVLIVAEDHEAQPHAEHAHDNASGEPTKHWRYTRGSGWGRRMAALRTLKQSAAERSASASKAARARWQRRAAEGNSPARDAAE
jgi:hypothetical protein